MLRYNISDERKQDIDKIVERARSYFTGEDFNKDLLASNEGIFFGEDRKIKGTFVVPPHDEWSSSRKGLLNALLSGMYPEDLISRLEDKYVLIAGGYHNPTVRKFAIAYELGRILLKHSAEIPKNIHEENIHDKEREYFAEKLTGVNKHLANLLIKFENLRSPPG